MFYIIDGNSADEIKKKVHEAAVLFGVIKGGAGTATYVPVCDAHKDSLGEGERPAATAGGPCMKAPAAAPAKAPAPPAAAPATAAAPPAKKPGRPSNAAKEAAKTDAAAPAGATTEAPLTVEQKSALVKALTPFKTAFPGPEDAKKLLAPFGVTKISDLKPSQIDAVVEAANAALVPPETTEDEAADDESWDE